MKEREAPTGRCGERALKLRRTGVDEILELIWTLREEGVSDLDRLLETTQDIEAKFILRLMIKDGLFQVEGNRMVLKERGEEKARDDHTASPFDRETPLRNL